MADVLRCSHRQSGVNTAKCTVKATELLVWTNQIDDGWKLTTERVFCPYHAEQYAELRLQGQAVERRRLG